MLSTTISEGRTVGPYSGSCLPRCCDSSNNVLWPPPLSSSSLPPLPFPLPPFLPPAAPASAETPLLQPEPAHLNRSSTIKARLSSEVTDSLFAPGGYNTPPSTSPFLPVAPYDLVAKDYHQSIAYSQANSIFVSSHTDYLSATSSISKKTETCIGRWEHSTLEPLHIQVPPLQPVASIVKTEGISCGSTRSSSKYDDLTPHSQSYHHHLQSNGGCSNSTGGLVTTMTTSSPSTTCMPSTNDIANGCSRTIPISWSTASSSSIAPSSTSTLLGSSGGGIPSPFPENLTSQHHAAPSSAVSSTSSVTLLQIKREPCQVSEVTTSNSLGHHHQQHHPHHHHQHQQQHQKTSSTLTAVVKLESPSPKSTVMDNHTISTPQNSAGAIPVGIAVARQRLQEHTATVTHQPKEVNRFGIGIADIGGAASVSSQNMFFAGTNSTMIPLSSEALSMGVSNVQNAVRTPPTFWQYPTPVPVESMLPMPIPPVGFQLVRDPSTGQYLFLPATATIEPFQPTVVWPTYPQPTAALQPPHLLLPPIAQSLQPPPLAPLQLLGSDYLATASTTLHQHTQTHSTRFVALTADGKRKPGTTVPLPIPHHAVIKIEDCNGGGATSAGTTATHHHQQHSTLFGDTKSASSLHTSAATITTAVQTNNMGGNIPTQLYYHQQPAGLIQIAPPHSQPSSMQECSPIIPSSSPPPLAVSATLPATSPKVTTCLSSPMSESIVPENLEAATSCVPDVQDATIQTDTPVMSEDDNTVGADECSLPSHTDEGRDGLIHSSTSLIQRPSSTSPECHNVTSNIQEDVQHEELVPNEIETDSSRNDSGFDSNAVTSTNSLEEPSVVSEQWTYSNNIEENESEEMTAPNIVCEKEQEYRSISKVTSTPVDLSGLELLSNISIEAIEKKITYIKQEPIEEKRSPQMICQQEEPTEDKEPELTPEKYTSQHEQLGGLNLLCALAEQRIQEEVGKRHRKRSSSSTESHGSKKKKHKHSKSSKKSRSDKERKEKRRHRKSEDLDEDFKQEFVEENEGLDENLKETLNRVKAKYDKCSNCKNDDSSHCCKEKCNWPTTEELIRAMETDMMLRLADITRQCKEKKRELDEISPILQQRKSQQLSDRESTPLSSKSSVRSFQLDKLQICASKFSCDSPVLSENNQGIEIPKICSDTESSKFEDIETSSSSSSKRKRGNPKKQDDSNTETIVAKKPKSLVGYILASKNRTNENKDSAGFLTDETTVFSESSCKLKASAFTSESPIKQEPTEDENSKPPVLEPFAIFDEGSTYSYEKKYRRKSSKHHSKHKKSKSSKEKKRRSSEIKERKRKIDARCTLSAEHLDKDKTRVLTAMGGLFYAGYLSPLQPPDVYAVTLDGERGNRPHIMSREEVLRDAIIEVCPATVEEIPPGTRLCAYWSQQYRCLYPGTSAEPGTPDIVNDKKFVSVEFDDGDSGRIALEDIRFLLSDYPIVEYDPNPLLSLGKRKRRISQTHPEVTQKTEIITSTSSNYFDGDDDKSKLKCNIDKEERRKLKKMKKDKIKKFDADASESPGSERKHKKKHKCNEENCKHRKHKKRRKHKKHHHRENASNADSSLDADDYPQEGEGEEDFTIEQGDSVSQSGEADEEENNIVKRESEPSTFDPDLKEDTMTEEEVESSITESSGSVYDPGCKRERLNPAFVDNHSKIAAFLPARQLWAWAGKGHKRPAKGRTKKQFYRTIQRGKETITVGDSAVFLSTGRPDRPYIGRIECMWETSSSNKVVRVRWFYHPEETIGCPNLKFPGALFESPHEDENDVQTISHKCEVLPLDAYTKKFGQDPKQYQNIYDNNDTYYLAGYYDPTAQTLKLQADIPTLAENDKWA